MLQELTSYSNPLLVIFRVPVGWCDDKTKEGEDEESGDLQAPQENRTPCSGMVND
jgi:hypothetical protein